MQKTRDVGLIPGLGRSPGGGHGNPLQNSCLENPMDRGAWQATVGPQGCKESDTTEVIQHKCTWWVGGGASGEKKNLPTNAEM